MPEQDVKKAAAEAVYEALSDGEMIQEVARLEETPLTLEDVIERLPYGRTTVLDMIKRRQIPMVKRRGKWIINREEYRKAVRRNFEAPRGVRTA